MCGSRCFANRDIYTREPLIHILQLTNSSNVNFGVLYLAANHLMGQNEKAEDEQVSQRKISLEWFALLNLDMLGKIALYRSKSGQLFIY